MNMFRLALTLVGLVVAAAAPLQTASVPLTTLPARAFLWANQPFSGPVGDGKIAYDATPSSALAAMLQPAVGTQESSSPEVTVVVIGEHMLATPNTPSTAAELENLRQGAQAWSSFQQVVPDSNALPLAHQLAAAAPKTHIAGDCSLEASETVNKVEGGVEGAADFLRTVAASQDKTPQLLLVCLPTGNAAAELAVVSALNEVLKQSGKGFVGMYTAQPQGAGVPQGGSRRHLLLFGFGEDSKESQEEGPKRNDELFVLQANLLRAFFVVLFTLVALLSGLCCMMSLDTPTRFESAKDDRR